MYTPAVFRETRPEVIERTVAAHRLATLVTLGSGGLEASLIPLLYDRDAGVLRGHMARANPQWREYVPDTEALAIFHGPQHYISPAWYPSKEENGKVVPTWNYVAVQARGELSFSNDRDWLLQNVRALTDAQEAGHEKPWRVEDAPPDFIENMLGAIVGVEMKVTALDGKWKVSQNRSIPDREGVIGALQRLSSAASIEMADLVKATIPE